MKLPSPAAHTVTIFFAAMVASPTMCTDIGDIIWEDNFDGDQGAVNSDYWNHDIGRGPNSDGWGNQQLQTYTNDPSNVRVFGGNLEITAIRDAMASNAFTSGRINTKGKVLFKYGTLEARIQLPSVVEGVWPAFWTLGGDFDKVSWPASGEIDIAILGAGLVLRDGARNSRITSGAHWAAGEDQRPRADVLHSNHPYRNVAGSNGSYFTYKMDWTPAKILTWVVHDDPMVDDFKLWEFGIDSTSCPDCHDEFHKEHFVVLNLAVGGLHTAIPPRGHSSSSSSSSSTTYHRSDLSSSFTPVECDSLSSSSPFSSSSRCGDKEGNVPRTEVSAAMPATMNVDFVRIRQNEFTEITMGETTSAQSGSPMVVDPPRITLPLNFPTPSPVAPILSPPITKTPANFSSPSPSCQSIAQIVCANENTTALCSYLSQAAEGVKNLLAGKNSDPSNSDNELTFLTVFAPNDEAFKALGPPNLVESLFPDQEIITNVLMTHIVEHSIPILDLPCGGQIQMANNEFTETLCVSSFNIDEEHHDIALADRVFQIGNGNVEIGNDRNSDENKNTNSVTYPEIVDFDIPACNGIIHVLDKVILPTNNAKDHKVPSPLLTTMLSSSRTRAPLSSLMPSRGPSARGSTGQDTPSPGTGLSSSSSGKSGSKSSKTKTKSSDKTTHHSSNLNLLQSEYSYFMSPSLSPSASVKTMLLWAIAASVAVIFV
eukprot:CAMPEP_0168311488 /NCGR_PEP_ID=MMETSP0142_2-20121227/67393_1 /TAXON_ID=44445 /ORGANISM="Pseudo-nitzschia australis, Strain 10249 10 AB" /LENGTH=710 /DNA_ID=CAMNT_0008264395 /DNA_START=77 /DNA_END=2209 /DNA_ORIENTATION=+